MSLKERLFDDLKTAMKEKDAIKKEVIQMVRAGVLQVEKDNKIESLDDSGVLTVISKEIKKLKDVLPDFEKAGRQDLIDEVNKKVEVLDAYLPEQMNPAASRSFSICIRTSKRSMPIYIPAASLNVPLSLKISMLGRLYFSPSI